MGNIKRGLSILVLVFVTLVPAVANTLAATWTIEAVDYPDIRVGDLSSKAIAVDISGHPHIVFGGYLLYYAYYDGNSWSYETVDLQPNAGRASIILDASGKVHISYGVIGGA